MKKAQTVQGLVSEEDLGFTYPHEHLICYPPEIAMKEDPDYELPREDKAIEELKSFQEVGGNCLVEGTAIDYGRDPQALQRISRAVDVNIIFATGFNKERFYPNWVINADMLELKELMVTELKSGAIPVGAAGLKEAKQTSVKPGYIKCGSWYNVIKPEEKKGSRAAARAHKETGAPIWVHTEAGTMGLEQLDILEEEGVDMSRVCVGHLDRNADLWYHKKIAERGAYVGYDGPSKIKYYPDSVRVELIKEMIDEGYLNQLLISGDMGRKSYLKSYGGGPGFEFILQKFIPRLLEEGLTEEAINKIWCQNPADWLCYI